MSIRTVEELAGMQRAGALVARTLRVLAGRVRAGITTGELDAVAAREFARAGAVSAPATLVGFPGTICVSVNDEVVHGVPGARRLREGNLRRLLLVTREDGWTVATADGSLAAHLEHTVVVAAGGPLVLTA